MPPQPGRGSGNFAGKFAVWTEFSGSDRSNRALKLGPYFQSFG